MKRVLILGCNDITERLLTDLCKHRSYASDICLSSRQKQDCDELKNLASSMGVRVVTSGIDVKNVEGAMMMVKIFAPDLVINLLPPELALEAMSLAVKAKADYIDGTLFGVPDIPSQTSLLSKQFKKFAEFQSNGKTAVCGAGFIPGAVGAIIRCAAKNDFNKINSIDIVSVSGEKNSSQNGDKEEIDYTLYSEDVKVQDTQIYTGPVKRVFYIEKGRVIEADPMSIEGRSSSGSKVYLDSSPMLTDLLKEIPDIDNVRYFKLGRKPSKEHIPPKEKLDLLEELGLLSNKPVRVGNVQVAPVDLLAAILPKMIPDNSAAPKTSDVKAEGISSYEIYITGRSKNDDSEITRSYIIKGDNDKSYSKYNVNAFEYMKGTALIAGVKLMCKDKWKKPGVFTPAAFDCDAYYNAFTMEGISIIEGRGKPF
ncbi:MAG: saccharopine dehydrogenase NADP-binding domain-containing protein [Saccharofermentans sp.]|nr:saccharopine dehydrogenase NADP-binding domain-containing protein [Saccharofermentans sp.]